MSFLADSSTYTMSNLSGFIQAGTGLASVISGLVSGTQTIEHQESKVQPYIQQTSALNQQQIDVQEKVADMQNQITLATQRREARKRAAAVAARTMGAGVSGSVYDAPVTSIYTSLGQNEDYIQKMSDLQGEQFNLQRKGEQSRADMAIAESNAKINQAISGMIGDGIKGAAQIGTGLASLNTDSTKESLFSNFGVNSDSPLFTSLNGTGPR